MPSRSIYATVAATIFTTVIVTMAAHGTFHYLESKERIVEEIKSRSKRSIEALTLNLSGMIEAYAANEYNKLLLAEMERRGARAIVLEDYKLGEVMGTDAFVSGKIRTPSGRIVEYVPDNPTHARAVRNCFHSQSVAITGDQGEVIGTARICISGEAIDQELNRTIAETVQNTLLISLMLTALLFAVMSRFLLRPLSHIADSVRNRDADGVPHTLVPEGGPTELRTLARALNHMIEAIGRAQSSLRDSEYRWKFAVEGSGDGLWDWNLETNEVFFSPQWKRMLGYEDHEIAADLTEWEKRVHPEDLPGAYEDVRRHLDGETDVYINRHRMRCKDGTYIWILDRGIVVERNQYGEPTRLIGTHSDISEQMRHQEELEYSATHDSLTALPNRYLFNELIQNAMHRSQRSGKQLALLYIDLDGFKEINDVHGHDVGDALLITVAGRMQHVVRQEDIVARLGGDEFVIAVSDLNNEEELTRLLRRLMHEIELPYPHRRNGVHQLRVSASIGVTFYPQAGPIGPDALLRQADQAMYTAKESGKDQFAFFDIDANAGAKAHQQQVAAFETAINNDQLELHYQPQVDMSTGQVLGFEALLRWHHPERGLLTPDSFLPQLSSERKVMLALGAWVMETGFAQLAQLHAAGHPVDLALNISTHELKSDATYELLQSLLRQHPEIRPGQIHLELLEVSALDDVPGAESVIRAWQRLGVRVALDDFGTGYSTLDYLRNLPVDTLKIDKGFVRDMLDDSASFSILEAAMGLARAFRCDVVAEGVESVEQGVMLLQLGCRVAQGYAIARPMPADRLVEWLQNHQGEPRWQKVEPLGENDWTRLYAVVEHRHWMRMLRDHLEAPGERPSPELDSHRCRFGEWLDDARKTDRYQTARLDELDQIHEQLHRAAGELIGPRPLADTTLALKPIEALHLRLVEQLKALD